MAVSWTEEQRRVIDVRDKDVLVSAAAGSGKTAVLVERIISRITDPVRPVDIDRLLVVTFTNAAAAEMRERIRDALEQRAEEEPDNVHLQRQLVLVHNARITTIHSFCLDVLRNHFQLAGIDPGFRIADQGEVMLLEQDAVKETVDEAYEQADEVFFQFLEEFVPGKNDGSVEGAILQVYHFALGQPWPREWLEMCRAMYGEETGQNLPGMQDELSGQRAGEAGTEGSLWALPQNARWLQYIAEDTQRLLADIEGQIRGAIRIAEEPDGPYPYLKALQ